MNSDNETTNTVEVTKPEKITEEEENQLKSTTEEVEKRPEEEQAKETYNDNLHEEKVETAPENLNVDEKIEEKQEEKHEEVVEEHVNKEKLEEIVENKEPIEAEKEQIENPEIKKEDNVEAKEEQEAAPVVHDKSFVEAETLLKELKYVYSEHKLEEANRMKQKLIEMRNSIYTHDVQAYHDMMVNETALFKAIDEEMAYLKVILADLNSEQGWTIDAIDAKSRMYYKVAPNGLSTTRIEAEVKVPVLHLMAMINEIELWPLWNAFMNKTYQIKNVSRGARIYYINYALPYPLADRELYLYGVGINRLYEDGTILMMAQSIEDNKEFLERHEIKKLDNKGKVSITIHVGGFEVTPLDRERCILRGIANLDPKFNWVPRKIMNWAIKKGTKEMVEKIIAGAKNFKGSPWEKQIKSEDKKEFYEWLNMRLEEYHDTRERAAAAQNTQNAQVGGQEEKYA